MTMKTTLSSDEPGLHLVNLNLLWWGINTAQSYPLRFETQILIDVAASEDVVTMRAVVL